MYYDGTGYIKTPSFAIPNTGILTIEAWTKQQINATTHQTIFGDPNNSPTVGFIDMIRLMNDSHLRYYYADGSVANNAAFVSFFAGLDNQ
jgi:hypothetical protein